MGPSGIGASLGSSAATMSGEGGVAVNDSGEGDVTVGDWGDASPPMKIGMTSSRVGDGGHSSPRKRPCG